MVHYVDASNKGVAQSVRFLTKDPLANAETVVTGRSGLLKCIKSYSKNSIIRKPFFSRNNRLFEINLGHTSDKRTYYK